MNKKALFISGLVGIVAVGSSFGAYSALHETDDPITPHKISGTQTTTSPAPVSKSSSFEASGNFASISTLECLFDGATSLGLDFSSVFQIAPTGFEPPAEYLQVASDCGFPITDEPTSSEASPPQMSPIPAGELASLGEIISTDGPVTHDEPGDLPPSPGVPAPGFYCAEILPAPVGVDELIVPVEADEPRFVDGHELIVPVEVEPRYPDCHVMTIPLLHPDFQ